MTPQQAADSVVCELEDKLMSRFGRAGDLSVVCMNRRGEFSAATNIKTFSCRRQRDAAADRVLRRARSGENPLPAGGRRMDAGLCRTHSRPIEE